MAASTAQTRRGRGRKVLVLGPSWTGMHVFLLLGLLGMSGFPFLLSLLAWIEGRNADLAWGSYAAGAACLLVPSLFFMVERQTRTRVRASEDEIAVEVRFMGLWVRRRRCLRRHVAAVLYGWEAEEAQGGSGLQGVPIRLLVRGSRLLPVARRRDLEDAKEKACRLALVLDVPFRRGSHPIRMDPRASSRRVSRITRIEDRLLIVFGSERGTPRQPRWPNPIPLALPLMIVPFLLWCGSMGSSWAVLGMFLVSPLAAGVSASMASLARYQRLILGRRGFLYETQAPGSVAHAPIREEERGTLAKMEISLVRGGWLEGSWVLLLRGAEKEHRLGAGLPLEELARIREVICRHRYEMGRREGEAERVSALAA